MGYSVLFDMDGVLVDSEPVINAAAIKGLEEYGIQAKPEDFLPFVGAGEDRYVGGVAEKYGLAYRVEMKHRVYQIYLETVDEKIKVFEGARELLRALRDRGLKSALASSADRIKIDANLKAAGIPRSLFDAIVSGEDVADKKPSPDIYLYAADKLGAAPRECIVVEDALNGVQAAKAAGMRCIALTTSFSREALEKEGPDFICDGLAEVERVINRIP